MLGIFIKYFKFYLINNINFYNYGIYHLFNLLLGNFLTLTLPTLIPPPTSPTQDSPQVINCTYRPIAKAQHLSASLAKSESSFILALTNNNQEIENQYIANAPLYTRVLQYLNYDIAQDVYLRLPNQTDSIAAITASYPRQYGSTGHSSVLLVFPVSEQQLRHGCFITFKGEKLELGTRRFTFTAHDIKAAREGQRRPH